MCLAEPYRATKTYQQLVLIQTLWYSNNLGASEHFFVMKRYRIKKLTRQYNGFDHYKWLIECDVPDEIQNQHDLADWREFCWQTWGASRELLWAITRKPVPVWAWDTEWRHKRLYLRSDAELSIFQLKF